MKKKVSIIASFRNEEKNINEFIDRINNSFKKRKHIDYELIFIDDFSNDLSNTLIKKACTKNKRIKLITLKKNYGSDPSIQTGFDFVNKKNYAAVIDCDLQEQPELIARNLSKIEKDQTIHFVRKKREDNFFKRFYSKIAYLILHFISKGKIIMNTNHFKIIPPHVAKKIKKNKEIHPYWSYLFTKYSSKNKVVYYVKRKRIYGRSKFGILSLNPWLTFFSGVHYFRRRFINTILILLIINFLILLLIFYNFYHAVLILFINLFILFLIANLIICSFVMYYKKKNKRIFCKYK
jgi:dolichol-phosphate mannosyltransferase